MALASIATVVIVDRYLSSTLGDNASNSAQSLARQLQDTASLEASCETVRRSAVAATLGDAYVVVSEPDGTEACRSDLRQPAISRATLARLSRALERGRDGSVEPVRQSSTTVDDIHLQLASAPIPAGLVTVAVDRAPVRVTVRSVAIVLGSVALVGALTALLVGVVVAGSATGSLDRLVANVDTATSGANLGVAARIDPVGAPDLDRVADAFNDLLERIDLLARGQRQLLVDAAHQLRTPLTSARTNVHTLRKLPAGAPERDEVARDIAAQLESLSRLIDDLVDLTAMHDRWALTATMQTVDIAMLASAAVDEARSRYPAHSISLEVDRAGTVTGDADLLARALANVIDNAVCHAGAGSTIDVRCTVNGIEVRDDGPGFGADDPAALLQPFHRGRTASSTLGTGLGLAFTTRIADLHGGSVHLDNHDGGGARVRIELPRAGDSQETPRNR